MMTRISWRFIAQEQEWALNQAHSRNNDRNLNRMAQVTKALEYGMSVRWRVLGGETPVRPDLDRVV